MIKTKCNNDVIECTGEVYTRNNIKLLWPIRSSVDCDENQISNDMTDPTNMVYDENET